MSQLVLQTPLESRESSVDSLAQDSPPMGRTQSHLQQTPAHTQIRQHSNSHSPSPVPCVTSSSSVTSSLPSSVLSSTGARFRKPAPSPLHNTHVVSPPSSVSPSESSFNFEFEAHDSPTTNTTPTSENITTTTTPINDPKPPPINPRSPRRAQKDSFATVTPYYHSDSSATATPDETKTTPRPALSSRFPNDSGSVSDFVVNKKSLGGPTKESQPAMAGSSRMETVMSIPRNSSIDSTVSSVSTSSSIRKNSQDVSNSSADIAKLIKAAGTPEAVIQYLLKEKQSQAQQNSQLWRLVDKQRAMILGLNKDLERALKDKEKYRKKLKEVMASPPMPGVPSPSISHTAEVIPSTNITKVETEASKGQGGLDVPVSPSVSSDKGNQSPIDVAMAPYPITPPADRIGNGPPSAVGELLDPSHSMPESSEHALDQFDHEAHEKEAEDIRRRADDANEIPIHFALPPSRKLPRQPPPPQGLPPPPPQQASADASPTIDDGLARFPPPPQPPPRKPPPAPLQLKELNSSRPLSPDDDPETDSDLDNILQVDEITSEKRGRRRTRQEDEQDREVLAVQVAEARSLSKKSKKRNSSAKGTPKEASPEGQIQASPMPVPSPVLIRNNSEPVSLVGVLNGEVSTVRASTLMTPGLPASPRPLSSMSASAPTSMPTSPPLSPRLHGGMPSAPLSPRAPRQPIPLPPNTPLETPSPPNEPLVLKSPIPLNIVKKVVEDEADVAESPTTSISRESPIERTHIFKGFVTEEFPDLLLPPNALPSVDIRVASSRMKPSRASLISFTQLEEDPVFTLAVLSRADGGELWRVEKDIVSLAKLDQRLKQCAAFTAKTPDRSLFSGHAPAKLDARRVALNQYMDELLNTPLDTVTAVELCKYLSSNTLPPNADETGGTVVGSVSETPLTGPGGRPFKSGYLTKRGKNFGGWKARFFVLDGPRLKYYETPGGAHLGTIKLQKSQIGKQSHHNPDSTSPQVHSNEEADNQYRHAFLILEPKKKDPSALTKHVLCAESDKDRDKWVDTLLRWIDYKDEEDEPRKMDAVQERQVSSSAHVNGMNPKKKLYGQGRNPQLQAKDMENPLIGVSYDATKQGNLPQQGGPAKPKAQDHSDHLTMSSQPSYTISAPRDPQVIPADSSMWSGKMAMGSMPGMGGLPPGSDEKKARKRSFFGFGPKQRSSSDGTDSLFGENSGSSVGSREVYSGPVRQVFGSPLAEAVRFNHPRDVRVPLPAVVYRCIQYLDAKGAISEEGIFRLSGSNVVIKQLRERFNNESDINLVDDEQYYDIHAIASLLKLYLRELPTTILTRALHLEFLAVTELDDQAEKSAALHDLTERLPQANATLLKYLIAFLIKIINHADQNKMTVRNVGIVFSPTLNIPAPVFAMFLQNYEAIFGIEPEEYSLPSPASIEERHERQSSSMDLPLRPSTAGGARESPHRQRLAEALQEGRRGNTPPPAGLNPLGGFTHTARSTPTPPPMQQHGYEPQYLAQQNSGSNNVTMRPAYENGFIAPSGYDPSTMYNPAAQRMVNPGYDRPIYETGAAFDQPQTSRANRRESAMWQNLTPQGSRSRLREEAPF